MRSHRQPTLLTVAFFVWFAAWFVADRYVSADFYKFELGQAVQVAFGLLAAFLAIALVLVPFIRPNGRQKPRWRYASLCLVPLLLAEFLWRLVMNDMPWDFVKGLGIVLDIATPALLALGVAALVSEWRMSHSAVAENTAP